MQGLHTALDNYEAEAVLPTMLSFPRGNVVCRLRHARNVSPRWIIFPLGVVCCSNSRCLVPTTISHKYWAWPETQAPKRECTMCKSGAAGRNGHSRAKTRHLRPVNCGLSAVAQRNKTEMGAAHFERKMQGMQRLCIEYYLATVDSPRR